MSHLTGNRTLVRMTTPRFLEIAVEGMHAGSDSATLTYSLPKSGSELPAVGRLAWVPLRREASLGVVVASHEIAPDFPVRAIYEVLPEEAALSAEQVAFSIWLQRQTAGSLFACLRLWMPPGVEYAFTPWFELRRPLNTATRQQARVMEQLRANGAMSLPQLQAALGSSLVSVIPCLEESGAIYRKFESSTQIRGTRTERWLTTTNVDVVPKLTQRQREVMDVITGAGPSGIKSAAVADRTAASPAVVARLVDMGLVSIDDRPPGAIDDSVSGYIPTLTTEQAIVWSALEAELLNPTNTPQLLFGVTGSGKTELYLRAIAATLRRGKGAIVLVPEIALTGHIGARVRERFPGRVAVLHSGLSPGARQEAWKQIASGERSIVVGPRSALFAPVQHPGLYVLDEEHDPSYKQDSDPRYSARKAAEELARRNGAMLILGSATPSIETLFDGEQGAVAVHRLTRRAVAAAQDLPPVQVVDIRQELGTGNLSFFSRALIDAVKLALDRKEQAMLLLNRRGMATVVLCRSCGHAITCPNCAIPLVYHRDRQSMICHRCDHREAPLSRCPVCTGPLDYFGAGTQRIEAEVGRFFPGARVVRWDMDVNRRAGAANRILKSIEAREIDVIVGTQLIAKGLDLPFVTTVGIVNADVGLFFPDFRAGERTFQLVTQMAGRAGRRTPHSRVIVQTYSPDHYVLEAASRHDVVGFFEREIVFRRQYRYPPFVRMIRYALRRSTDEECAIEADAMVRTLGRHAHSRGVTIDIVGPAPAFVARIRGESQWHLILKAAPNELDLLLDSLPHPPGWVVDIDPVSLL
jgi:primosomal protein N' (replication factor Y)